MAPNTALAFVALGLALMLRARGPAPPWVAPSIQAACGLVGAASLFRLGELLFGVDAASDRWFLRPAEDLLAAWRPEATSESAARMSAPTALGLVLASGSLMLLTVDNPRARRIASVSATAVAAVGLLFTLGYLYGAPLFHDAPAIPVALSTALGFVLLGAGLVAAAGAEVFPLAPFSGLSIHARLRRAFLPFAAGLVCLAPVVTNLAAHLVGGAHAALYGALLIVLAAILAGLICARIADGMEVRINRLEEQLRQSQKMDAVGRLAGGVSHEFNNVLTVINGYCDLILSGLHKADPLRDKVEEIRKAGDRASRLTRRLLTFSRKEPAKPVPLDLNALIADLLKMLRLLIPPNVEIVHAPDSALGLVLADASQMEQVVMNLVVNARDAMPEGGRVTLTTANVDVDDAHPDPDEAAPPGRYVRLEVADTGRGMDDDVRSHLFEPFFTTKKEVNGNGLGLAIVHGNITQSGGTIAVTSVPGRGTTFRIHLPRIEAGAPEEALPSKGRGSGTVLVVEDDDDVQALVRVVLEHEGYQVLQARDGEEALSICRKAERIDLMVTDSVMPLLSGPDLADKAAPLRPGLKVLYMSAKEPVAIPGNFLQKPFTVDALRQKVREAIVPEGEKPPS
jgi:signal transduction histidine kinase/CheY-like chemotaxis protein